jgi:hypothetical protein
MSFYDHNPNLFKAGGRLDSVSCFIVFLKILFYSLLSCLALKIVYLIGGKYYAAAFIIGATAAHLYSLYLTMFKRLRSIIGLNKYEPKLKVALIILSFIFTPYVVILGLIIIPSQIEEIFQKENQRPKRKTRSIHHLNSVNSVRRLSNRKREIPKPLDVSLPRIKVLKKRSS